MSIRLASEMFCSVQRISFVFITLCIFSFAADKMAYASAVIGTSAAVKGKVFVTTRGAERKAQVRDKIQLEDQVATKEDSALQILLLDESIFTVGQNCVMTIDRFVYDPESQSGNIAAKVTRGTFRFMSGNIGASNPTDAEILTPNATIGIRGTFFESVVGADSVLLTSLAGMSVAGADPNKASITILRGPGPDRNTFDRRGLVTVSTAGGSVNIQHPGFAVFDPGNGQKPIGPFRFTPEMREYMDFYLRSRPNGPAENPIPLESNQERFSGQEKFEDPIELHDDIFDALRDGILDPLTEPPGDPCNGPNPPPDCISF